MIKAARDAGRAVLVDPKGSDYERYAGATVITPNRNELAQVIGALVAARRSCTSARRRCANRSASTRCC